MPPHTHVMVMAGLSDDGMWEEWRCDQSNCTMRTSKRTDKPRSNRTCPWCGVEHPSPHERVCRERQLREITSLRAFVTEVQKSIAIQSGPPEDYVPGAYMAHKWWRESLGHDLDRLSRQLREVRPFE